MARKLDEFQQWFRFTEEGTPKEWWSIREKDLRAEYDTLIAHGFTPADATELIASVISMTRSEYGD